MEEKDVARRLDDLENNIRGTFDRGTNFELEECEASISRTIRDLEYALNGYRVGSPATIDEMVSKLKHNLKDIKTLIEDTRDDEKRFTVGNLQRTSIKLDEAIENLEQLEVEGIRPTGQDDIVYEEEVKQIVDTQTREFIREYGITDSRVIEELQAQMRSLKNGIINKHDRISVSMKYTIKDKVVELGRELVEEKEKRDKSDKSDDFAASLRAQTISDIELADMDAKKMSENEKAFRDNEQPSKDNKSKYEAMFK